MFCGARKMTQKIDYSKLNDQIVKQAYRGFPALLSPEDKQRLINEKIERARLQFESYKSSVVAY